MKPTGERVQIRVGDITRMEVDAVVNAANSSLLGGGGVDGAIHRAGGPEILRACSEIRRTEWPQGMPPGQAVATTAGNLPARYVIHTVGPVWQGGNSGEAGILASAYTQSLGCAADLGLQSIAFPAISTGVYGYPKTAAAAVAWAAVTAFLATHTAPALVLMVFLSTGESSAFCRAVGGRAVSDRSEGGPGCP